MKIVTRTMMVTEALPSRIIRENTVAGIHSGHSIEIVRVDVTGDVISHFIEKKSTRALKLLQNSDTVKKTVMRCEISH